MRKGGLEPPRPEGHWHLKPAKPNNNNGLNGLECTQRARRESGLASRATTPVPSIPAGMDYEARVVSALIAINRRIEYLDTWLARTPDDRELSGLRAQLVWVKGLLRGAAKPSV